MENNERWVLIVRVLKLDWSLWNIEIIIWHNFLIKSYKHMPDYFFIVLRALMPLIFLSKVIRTQPKWINFTVDNGYHGIGWDSTVDLIKWQLLLIRLFTQYRWWRKIFMITFEQGAGHTMNSYTEQLPHLLQKTTSDHITSG